MITKKIVISALATVALLLGSAGVAGSSVDQIGSGKWPRMSSVTDTASGVGGVKPDSGKWPAF